MENNGKFQYRLDIIESKIDKLVEINEEQTKSLHSHEIRFIEYNALLEKHIEGVVQNRNAIREIKKELNEHKHESQNSHNSLKTEIEPLLMQRKVLSYIKHVMIGIGGLFGALASVLAVLKYLGKI